MSEEPVVEAVAEPVAQPTQAEPNLMSQAKASVSSELDWMKGIDEQFLASQSVTSAKTPNDLAKQVFNLEKVIGKPRLPMPEETWGENEYNEFYQKLGRPESPDAYKLEGLPPEVAFSDDEKKQLLTSLHQSGLNNKQANSVMKAIAERELNLSKSVENKFQESEMNAKATLEKQWGDKFEHNLRLASSTLNQLTDPDTASQLEQMAGNNPAFIKLLAEVGNKFMREDSAFKGQLQSNSFTSPVAARGEIEQLKADPLFIKQLMTKEDPGHKLAQEKWTNLHKQAYQ